MKAKIVNILICCGCVWVRVGAGIPLSGGLEQRSDINLAIFLPLVINSAKLERK